MGVLVLELFNLSLSSIGLNLVVVTWGSIPYSTNRPLAINTGIALIGTKHRHGDRVNQFYAIGIIKRQEHGACTIYRQREVKFSSCRVRVAEKHHIMTGSQIGAIIAIRNDTHHRNTLRG